MCLALVSCDNITNSMTYPEMDYNSFYRYFITTPEEQLSQSESVYYIYIYSTKCDACFNIKNEALYTIEFLSNDTVYFVEALSTDLNDAITITGTPAIIKIVNGEVVEQITGGSKVLEVLHGLS